MFWGLKLIPAVRPPSAIAEASFQWNYTTWLDFLPQSSLCGWFVWIHFQDEKTTG